MDANAVPRSSRMPDMDMIIKSVSDVKRNYSKIIKEIKIENRPAVIMNNNTPETIIMSYQYYSNIIVDIRTKLDAVLKNIDQIEDDELCAKAESRLKGTNNIWLTSDEIVGSKTAAENPYDKMSDDELFD